nr:type II toxin-antitoxin system RelE/ParE family toxin [uncultured Flavobacterium sp.]
MVRIIWSAQAVDNLRNISEYISKDSSHFAKVQVRKITQTTKTLKKLPYSGRIVPEINEQNVRELILGNYRIIYEILPVSNIITILTVHHSARNFIPEDL